MGEVLGAAGTPGPWLRILMQRNSYLLPQGRPQEAFSSGARDQQQLWKLSLCQALVWLCDMVGRGGGAWGISAHPSWLHSSLGSPLAL